MMMMIIIIIMREILQKTNIYIYIYNYFLHYLSIYVSVCFSVCLFLSVFCLSVSFSKYISIYICVYIYVVHSISFLTFLQAFKIVVDSWEFSMLLQYILWDCWPVVMISGSNERLKQQLEYDLLKPDCHSWWISKMQSDTLKERYALKCCFKLGKNAIETYGLLFDHLA